MPDSVYRVLAGAGVTLLSIVASLVVPASLGAFRVGVFGADLLKFTLPRSPIPNSLPTPIPNPVFDPVLSSNSDPYPEPDPNL